jgi:hypothetical protein
LTTRRSCRSQILMVPSSAPEASAPSLSDTASVTTLSVWPVSVSKGAVARAPELDRIVVARGDHGRPVRGVDIAGVALEPGAWGPLLHVPDDRCVVDAAMVQASTQDKGAASTDLTAESGAAPAQTLAADWPAPTVSKPTAEQDQAEHLIAKRSRLLSSMRFI